MNHLHDTLLHRFSFIDKDVFDKAFELTDVLCCESDLDFTLLLCAQLREALKVDFTMQEQHLIEAIGYLVDYDGTGLAVHYNEFLELKLLSMEERKNVLKTPYAEEFFNYVKSGEGV